MTNVWRKRKQTVNKPFVYDVFMKHFIQFMAKPFKDPSKKHLIDKFNNTYYLDDVVVFLKIKNYLINAA